MQLEKTIKVTALKSLKYEFALKCCEAGTLRRFFEAKSPS